MVELVHTIVLVIFWISLVLAVIGALNWGVTAVDGHKDLLTIMKLSYDVKRAIYGIVGVAGVLLPLSVLYLLVMRQPISFDLAKVYSSGGGSTTMGRAAGTLRM